MATQKLKPYQYLLQAINYTIFMALIWYFATAPAVTVITEKEAMLTMAFGHAGETLEPCRQISTAELNELPANMRNPMDCPRERSPIKIELILDGELVFINNLQPPGLFNDGSVDIYISQKISAGEHRLEIKMDDSVRKPGYDYTFDQKLYFQPTKITLISFNTNKGFVVKS